MALSLFAARALLVDYLNGRTLPDRLQDSVVRAVESRLIGGEVPVLNRDLCEQIDSQAGELRTEQGTFPSV
ncbi:hypothetical protein LJR175_006483 [Variovorax sp. LjRoot175]|uniref:hypothetical protein n=1 Tax=Variovorax sp. LjRoot175 TaxID=3342276 RepID=UPI003ECF7043